MGKHAITIDLRGVTAPRSGGADLVVQIVNGIVVIPVTRSVGLQVEGLNGVTGFSIEQGNTMRIALSRGAELEGTLSFFVAGNGAGVIGLALNVTSFLSTSPDLSIGYVDDDGAMQEGVFPTGGAVSVVELFNCT